ncbi:formate/nitrite transporter family protein [Spiroplasma endosymbiont of Stenodema calcarata]|uniref:formate/nitrite transporter family protein n=1 Tax=Spiroplasma endosymbiont of Stenodema calcarata TaxID=3139328 RepID=UPI003CCAE511
MKDTIKIVKYQNQINQLAKIDTSVLEGHLSYSEQAIIGAFKSSDSKIKAGIINTLLNGFLGGLFISIGYIAALYAIQGITTPGIKLVIFGLVFPVGLLLVTFLGGGIYTSHCVGFINAVTGHANPSLYVRNLLLIFLSNFIGCLFAAVIIYYAAVFGNEKTSDLNTFGGQVMNTMQHKIGLIGEALAHGQTVTNSDLGTTFLNNLMSAIFCNILVAATLYVTYSSKSATASILCIFFILFAFCISGFQHVVANSFLFWMNVLMLGLPMQGTEVLPGASAGYFAGFNLLPAFIGNFLGGAVVIPTLGYFIARKKIDATAVNLKKENYLGKIKLLQLKAGFAEIIDNNFVLDQTKFNTAISNVKVPPKKQWFTKKRKD